MEEDRKAQREKIIKERRIRISGFFFAISGALWIYVAVSEAGLSSEARIGFALVGALALGGGSVQVCGYHQLIEHRDQQPLPLSNLLRGLLALALMVCFISVAIFLSFVRGHPFFLWPILSLAISALINISWWKNEDAPWQD
jgi:hypothetical protein